MKLFNKDLSSLIPLYAFWSVSTNDIPNMSSKVKKAMKFFNGKNTQQLKQPGGNGGREKNTKKRITMYFFVIFHGISVQSNSFSKRIRKR